MTQHIVQAVTLRWYNACAYYAVALARGIGMSGIPVTLIGDFGTPAPLRALSYGVPVETFPSVGTGMLSTVRLVRCYRRFALERQVSLVNVHTGRDHLLWTLALSGTDIPVVRTSGNQVPPNIHPGSRYLMKKTAGVIVSCKTIQRYYTEGFGNTPEAVPVINGGVDIDYYSPEFTGSLTRREMGVPDDAFLFGILARYSPDKGHEHFFQAAARVAERFSDVWFLVAGWKAQLTETDMRFLAEKAGVASKTIFAGKQADSRGLIGLLDAGVIASVNSETICRIAMEYMAMGVPVVATTTNVIPEVVRDGVSGIIVPAGDAERMAEAMMAMAESRERARAFGIKGREIAVREYSLDRFAEKTMQVYRECAGK